MLSLASQAPTRDPEAATDFRFVEAVRWALANGWERNAYPGSLRRTVNGVTATVDWSDPDGVVTIDVPDGAIPHAWGGVHDELHLTFQPRNLREARDVLAAVGLLPMELSLPFSAGFAEAGAR